MPPAGVFGKQQMLVSALLGFAALKILRGRSWRSQRRGQRPLSFGFLLRGLWQTLSFLGRIVMVSSLRGNPMGGALMARAGLDG